MKGMEEIIGKPKLEYKNNTMTTFTTPGVAADWLAEKPLVRWITFQALGEICCVWIDLNQGLMFQLGRKPNRDDRDNDPLHFGCGFWNMTSFVGHETPGAEDGLYEARHQLAVAITCSVSFDEAMERLEKYERAIIAVREAKK